MEPLIFAKVSPLHTEGLGMQSAAVYRAQGPLCRAEAEAESGVCVLAALLLGLHTKALPTEGMELEKLR